MAGTMAISELIYVVCCFIASRRIVPQIQIRMTYFTSSVFHELIRFAGSYQLVNILEVLYTMFLPVAMLKFYGAELAGVYAVATRLVTAVLIAQDALILPLLSGGTLVFASGSIERLVRFVKKSFKITLAVTLAPIAFVAAFGTLLVYVWTGQVDPHFKVAIWLVCLCSFLNSISRLQLILYRASGRALHDNIRQAFRLGVLAVLAAFGGITGFYGMLAGLAAAELVGVIYMFFAMTSALQFFKPKNLLPDALRLMLATSAMVGAAAAAATLPEAWSLNGRALALARLALVSLSYLIALWPAATLTRSISGEERRAVLSLLVSGKIAMLRSAD